MKRNNVLTVLAGVLACAASAEVKLGTPFADGMVLQRDREVAVWGTAEAGENLSVSFAGLTVGATADENGRWMAKLPKM